MFKWFRKNNNLKSDTETLQENVTRASILSAYKTREKEIESLRKYDRGEKKITPSNLKDIVQNI